MPTAKENKLLVYLIILLGLVMGFLYSNGSDPTADVPPLDIKLQTGSLQGLRGARIDDSILTSEAFKALRVFGSLPVEAGTGGKNNPFE